MNSSGGSFKPQASASDVRAGAQEDLDKLSMGSSRVKKKQGAVRGTLKPIAQTTTGKPKSHASDVIASNSLQHKRNLREQDGSIAIDMMMGPGIQINSKKKMRSDLMKDIKKDVNQFLQEYEETKKAATAFDDSVS
jgi:hypothetical protein